MRKLSLPQKRMLKILEAVCSPDLSSFVNESCIRFAMHDFGREISPTMKVLERLKFIETEYSTWNTTTKELVRCSCAKQWWRLTALGRDVCANIKLHVDEPSNSTINFVRNVMQPYA